MAKTDEKVNYIIREFEWSECEEIRDILRERKCLLSNYINEVIVNIDPKGILVAQHIDSGKLIGVCSGVNISEDLAFIGQYAVRLKYEGLGVGKALWLRVMQHIGPLRNVSLYSHPDMFDKYRLRSNFSIVPQKRLIHFTGKVNRNNNLITSIEGISLNAINEDNIRNVIQYDKQVGNGLDRTVLIEQVSKIDEYVNLVAINQKQEVVGYCVLCLTLVDTVVVEPMYADDQQIAELLIGKCCQMLDKSITNGLTYYCWDNNHKSIAIAEKLGLEVTLKQPILFTQKEVEGNWDKIFCINSRAFWPF